MGTVEVNRDTITFTTLTLYGVGVYVVVYVLF